ncbi:MAG: hypothetical protein ABI623_06485, partial [bacterium]
MAHLFEKEYNKEHLLARIGDLSQVAGIRMMQLSDGVEAGVRIADVRTGSGLRFQVSLDRGRPGRRRRHAPPSTGGGRRGDRDDLRAAYAPDPGP